MRFGAPLMFFKNICWIAFLAALHFYPFPQNEKLGNMEHWHLRYVLGTFGICALRKTVEGRTTAALTTSRLGTGPVLIFLKLVLSKQFGSSNACAGLLELFVHLHSGIVFLSLHWQDWTHSNDVRGRGALDQHTSEASRRHWHSLSLVPLS